MRGEGKLTGIPKPKKEKFDFFTWTDKITDKFSFKHLDRIIEKNDTLPVVFLIVVLVIFVKIWPQAENSTGYFLGLPYWLIIGVLFLIILIFALVIYNRKLGRAEEKKKKK